jgi:hypothetical protein
MPRTGTTSLFHLLGRHPQVFLPFRKELGAFLFNHDRGREWLDGVFRRRGPDQVGIDATPEYFFSLDALRRMAEFRPPVKVVLGIREPVGFARSLHAEYARRRYCVPPFEDFLDGFRYRRRGTEIAFRLRDRVVTRMVEGYRAALSDRLLLVDFAALRRDPLRLLRALERFAGLDPWFDERTFDNLVLNAGGRRNARWLSWLLGRESLISVLQRTLPRSLLLRASRAAYRAGATAAPPAHRSGAEPGGEDAEAGPDFLREEGARLRALFRRGSFILGSGAPLASADEDAHPGGERGEGPA